MCIRVLCTSMRDNTYVTTDVTNVCDVWCCVVLWGQVRRAQRLDSVFRVSMGRRRVCRLCCVHVYCIPGCVE